MKKLGFLVAALALFALSACGKVEAPIPPDGKVILEEFGDFQCPACKATQPLIIKLREHFPEQLIIRFVNFPLPQHEKAFHAAEAAECFRDQDSDKYAQYTDKLYENQSELGDELYEKLAAELGINPELFKTCLNSGDKAAGIRKNMAEGKARDVNSTPTLFLNGKLVEDRRYEVIVKQIEDLLKNAPAEGSAAPTQ